jgi:hypothetical protein
MGGDWRGRGRVRSVCGGGRPEVVCMRRREAGRVLEAWALGAGLPALGLGTLSRGNDTPYAESLGPAPMRFHV